MEVTDNHRTANISLIPPSSVTSTPLPTSSPCVRDDAPRPGADAVYTIGVLANHVTNAFDAAVLQGIFEYGRGHGLNLAYFLGGDIDAPIGPRASRNEVFALPTMYNVDGLIGVSNSLSSSASRERIGRFYRSFEPLPVVSIGIDLADRACVLADGLTGLRSLLVHVIKTHQARRIAFIGGPGGDEQTVARYTVYRSVLEEFGLPLDERLALPGSFTRASGAAAVSLLLDDRRVECDVFCAAHDVIALGAIEELAARGINVPRDIIVLGCGGLSEGATASPRLTTVRQPAFEMGYTACEMLCTSLGTGRAPNANRLFLAAEPLIGETCGCGAGRARRPRRARLSPAAGGIESVRFSWGDEHYRAVVEAGETLLAVSSWDDLRVRLSGLLSRVDAGSCYVSLFEERDGFPPRSFSRMVAAIEHNQPVDPSFTAERFLTGELVPGGLKVGRGNIYLVMNLLSPGHQRGFVLYEIGRANLGVLEGLTLEINHAVNRLGDIPPVQDALLPAQDEEGRSSAVKYSKSKLSLAQTTYYYRKITDLMEKEKIYRRPDLNIRHLSKMASISCHNASFVINTHAQTNFYTFVNTFRVREAITLLHMNPEKKIIDIAFSAGFKAKSTFNKAFKEYARVSPSAYVAELRRSVV